VAFLRLTRDHRGYENTYLLHAPLPGARPIVLYWYRSAPGVRVGRPALDEDAIRTIEEQHPDIEFDWPHILEVGAISEPEVERRPVRQKRRQGPPAKATAPTARRAESREQQEPAPPADQGPPQELETVEDAELIAAALGSESVSETEVLLDELATDESDEPAPRAHDLLEELVGHEIATRLHARYSEIISRVHRIPDDHPQRNAWQARAEALNPDNWVTPDEVLRGVSHADALFDALRQELVAD
jgi:hypothetical protein